MDVKGLHQCVLRGMSMKSRIVFMFVLASVISPISVMAFETSQIKCKEFADNKAKENAIALENGTGEIVNGVFQRKSKTSGSGG